MVCFKQVYLYALHIKDKCLPQDTPFCFCKKIRAVTPAPPNMKPLQYAKAGWLLKEG